MGSWTFYSNAFKSSASKTSIFWKEWRTSTVLHQDWVSLSNSFFPPEVPQLTNPRFTATTSGVTLAEALDWLCTLEPQYTWSRDGTTINIFPRATVEEKNYYFTRKLSDLVFREERNAYDAVEKVFKPVSTPKEAVIQWTGVRDYQTPYSATFKDITVREALNRLVQHVAPTEGWMVFGNRETMLLTMYDYISARSSAAH